MYRIYTVYILKMQQYRISEVRNIDIVVYEICIEKWREYWSDMSFYVSRQGHQFRVKMTEVIEVTNLG